MSRTFQCTTCDDSDNPSSGPDFTFVFDKTQRLKAARAAIDLASKTPDTFLSSHQMVYEGQDSARFMSLVYYAGGWPMVGHCPLEGAAGWYLYCPFATDTLGGSGTWNVHNSVPARNRDSSAGLPRQWNGNIKTGIDPTNSYTGVGLGGLVGFISGEVHAGGDHPDPTAVDYETSRTATLVPIGQVFNDDTNPNINDLNLRALLTSGVLDDFTVGDYVFLDSMDGNRDAEHGMLIVGFGPVVGPAGLSDQVEVAVDEEDDDGVVIRMKEIIDVAALQYYGAGDDPLYMKRVPYVVDWNSENNDPGRHQRPRPFFHTRLNHTDVQRYAHTYWLFVPAADSITVKCNWVFAQNVEGGPNADLLPRLNDETGVYE